MIFIKRLDRDFFLQNILELSKALLGKLIVREINGKRLIVRITEVEAYDGRVDKACHAYKYKKTQRTKTLFENGGLAYVYLIYGMYSCLNVVGEKEGEPCAVLIRGCEAVDEIDEMALNRFSKPYSDLNSYQKKNFLNGPGKICKALKIDKALNEEDMCQGDILYLAEDKTKTTEKRKIKVGKRINIDYAQEAVDFLWRFYYD